MFQGSTVRAVRNESLIVSIIILVIVSGPAWGRPVPKPRPSAGGKKPA